MGVSRRIGFGAGLALAVSISSRPISAQDVTRAFLHGYLLGKSGRATFNIDDLHKQTSAFIERCLDNPSERAVDAMSKIKG